jgi:hypothetical protein
MILAVTPMSSEELGKNHVSWLILVYLSTVLLIVHSSVSQADIIA